MLEPPILLSDPRPLKAPIKLVNQDVAAVVRTLSAAMVRELLKLEPTTEKQPGAVRHYSIHEREIRKNVVAHLGRITYAHGDRFWTFTDLGLKVRAHLAAEPTQ